MPCLLTFNGTIIALGKFSFLTKRLSYVISSNFLGVAVGFCSFRQKMVKNLPCPNKALGSSRIWRMEMKSEILSRRSLKLSLFGPSLWVGSFLAQKVSRRIFLSASVVFLTLEGWRCVNSWMGRIVILRWPVFVRNGRAVSWVRVNGEQ